MVFKLVDVFEHRVLAPVLKLRAPAAVSVAAGAEQAAKQTWRVPAPMPAPLPVFPEPLPLGIGRGDLWPGQLVSPGLAAAAGRGA